MLNNIDDEQHCNAKKKATPFQTTATTRFPKLPSSYVRARMRVRSARRSDDIGVQLGVMKPGPSSPSGHNSQQQPGRMTPRPGLLLLRSALSTAGAHREGIVGSGEVGTARPAPHRILRWGRRSGKSPHAPQIDGGDLHGPTVGRAHIRDTAVAFALALNDRSDGCERLRGPYPSLLPIREF